MYWYRKSAEQGFHVAQWRLGECYNSGNGVEKNYDQAVFWYTKAADQGLSIAQWYLAECYYNGEGVTKDYTKVVYWCQKAAVQNFWLAQWRLGKCYFYGDGVSKDYTKAVYWLEKASGENSNIAFVALYDLGYCYKNGYGVPKNEQKALELWVKSADKGYAVAQYLVGIEFYEAKDPKAFKYLKMTIDNNDSIDENVKSDVMRKISTCYRYGRCGVSMDEEKADYWMKEAAKYGNVDALKIQEWINGQN